MNMWVSNCTAVWTGCFIGQFHHGKVFSEWTVACNSIDWLYEIIMTSWVWEGGLWFCFWDVLWLIWCLRVSLQLFCIQVNSITRSVIWIQNACRETCWLPMTVKKLGVVWMAVTISLVNENYLFIWSSHICPCKAIGLNLHFHWGNIIIIYLTTLPVGSWPFGVVQGWLWSQSLSPSLDLEYRTIKFRLSIITLY